MKIQAFVFNWVGHESRAAALERALAPLVEVAVINSEELLAEPHPDWLHLGESAYFSAQWNQALASFDADIFFHIQADASCQDFPDLFARARDLFGRYETGILEPHVDHTDFVFDQRRLRCLEPGLFEVPMTDCTCWFIKGSLLRTMPPVDLSLNRFGWGICGAMAALCSLQGKLCLRDYTRTVIHPKGRGYPDAPAGTERIAYLKTLEPSVATRAFEHYRALGEVLL